MSVPVPRVVAPVVRFHRRSLLSRMPLRSRIAGLAILLVALLSLATPLLPIADPLASDLTTRLQPIGTPGHVLGTDGLGRDMLSRLLHGTGMSLFIGVAPVAIATVLGLAVGVVAGTARRSVNTLLMRAVDVLAAFPGVLLSILIAISLGQGVMTLLIALSVVWIAPLARIAETAVVRVRELDYVQVARSSGATTVAVLFRQILPVSLPAVIAYATSLVGANVAITGGLGFIGLGVPSPTPELGAMLQELQVAIYTEPTLALLPVAVIVGLSMLFPMLGDGLRQALAGKEER
ncbi:MAG: ABC transporter permease [Microbacteriaceae bacterium]